jgi:hypothetical protein
LAKNDVDLGEMLLGQGRLEQARQTLVSADPAFERGLALDPRDATLLEVRAAQFELLAQAAGRAGDRRSARERINQCLDVIGDIISRDPSAREYIGDYDQMLALARRLGVSTRNLR